MTTPDVVIIGSGIGGASVAAGLAGSGASILILEAGDHIARSPKNRDQRAIFGEGVFRPKEFWSLPDGTPFNPGNYYNVGGNSKFYGAVLTRYRREDFLPREHLGGRSPGWPFPYEELEPWYGAAEKLFRVRGSLGEDPTEPPHSTLYDFPPVPDEPAIALVRERLRQQGLHPFSLPLGVDIDTWLAHGKHPWDAHPNSDEGKSDAETCALRAALEDPNVKLQVRSRVLRLETDGSGRRIARVVYEKDGERHEIAPRLVVLAAGAVQSAALLLRSANDRHPNGLANASDQVGRNFMNHNCSAVLAVSPTYLNTSVYQKTFGINDYYNGGGEGGLPLGNIQLLGRVSGTILKANMPSVPGFVLDRISRHAIDFYAMSEDLPNPESRVTVDGDRIILDWKRSNWEAHLALVRKLKAHLRAAGFPLVLSRAFDRRTPSHQCGTVRIGSDPARAPLDVHGRAHDLDNLFVTDASGLPTSAAVNPALTVAALALRAADHIRKTELAA
jgi:Choline dehydrogenase and related flavoproteins